MKPLILAILLLLLVSVAEVAQTRTQTTPNKCSLTIEQSPEVRGLKLGQSFQSADELFPEQRSLSSLREIYEPDELNHRRVLVGSILNRSERLKGISSLNLQYLDDKLASISVRYDYSVRWQSSAHFAAAIAKQLQLPTTGWLDSVTPTLACNGFYVETFASGSVSTLKIERTDLISELGRRRAELERKRRSEFKP